MAICLTTTIPIDINDICGLEELLPKVIRQVCAILFCLLLLLEFFYYYYFFFFIAFVADMHRLMNEKKTTIDTAGLLLGGA
jgi:hypothetical protein